MNVYVPGSIVFDSCNNFNSLTVFLKFIHLCKLKADGAQRKTVIVFIHGGTFGEYSEQFVNLTVFTNSLISECPISAYGNAQDTRYGPDFLLSQDNIVVTLQYRLGIFGFLNLSFDDYTGNMGLKDQQLAIKWVYKNIEQFSGKMDEILLFGHSAGRLFDIEFIRF